MNAIVKTKKKKIITIVIIVIILLALASVGAYALIKKDSHTANSKTNTQTNTSSGSKSPSSNSKSQTDAPSDNSGGTADSTGATSGKTSSSVGVVIVDANQYGSNVEVRAYANALEDGTCTYTFSQGSSTITKQSSATAGASTTSCATLDVPTNNFASGTWYVKVSYSSNSGKYSGVSSSKSINIQ